MSAFVLLFPLFPGNASNSLACQGSGGARDANPNLDDRLCGWLGNSWTVSRTFSILFATVNLIGQTTSKAFIGILSKIGRHRPKEILSLLISTCKKSAIISAGPVLVLLIGGRPLFEFAFGGQWSQAGTFAQYLAPLLFAHLLVSPTASLITVIHKNKYNLRISFECCCLSVIPFVFALYYAMDAKYVIVF